MNKEKTIELQISTKAENGNNLFSNIELPATDYEIQDALQRARVMSESDEREYVCVYSSAIDRPILYKMDANSIYEINYLAERLASLNDDERLVLQAVADKYFKETDIENGVSVKDLINLTYGLDDVMIASNVGNTEELGQFVIDNELNEIVVDTPKDARQFLDKKMLGQLQQEIDGGIFANGKYFVLGSYEKQEVYKGELPQKDAEKEYAFKLEIASPISEDEEMSDIEENARWISLPISKEEANKMAKLVGIAKIEDCVYLGFESTIPQIERDNFGDMQDFDKLNNLSEMLLEMTPSDQVKFKAVLSAEEPSKIEDILEVARNLNQYELATQVENAEQFFKSYLERHMDKDFDVKWLDTLLLRNEGYELLEKKGACITDYGIVSCRGGSLYENIPREEPEIEQEQKLKLDDVGGN